MKQSLALFEYLTQLSCFRDVTIIVLLNKFDSFRAENRKKSDLGPLPRIKWGLASELADSSRTNSPGLITDHHDEADF